MRVGEEVAAAGGWSGARVRELMRALQQLSEQLATQRCCGDRPARVPPAAPHHSSQVSSDQRPFMGSGSAIAAVAARAASSGHHRGARPLKRLSRRLCAPPRRVGVAAGLLQEPRARRTRDSGCKRFYLHTSGGWGALGGPPQRKPAAQITPRDPVQLKGALIGGRSRPFDCLCGGAAGWGAWTEANERSARFKQPAPPVPPPFPTS